MSKFKAVPTESLPEPLRAYLNSTPFATRLLTEVLGVQMRIKNPTSRAAGHYVQKSDESIEVDAKWGIELTLSKVSVKDGRYFEGALAVMELILTEAVWQFVPKGRTVDIFCLIITDVPVPGTSSTLYEMENEVRVEGRAAA